MSSPTRILLIEDDEEDYMITRDLLDDITHRKYKLDWIDNFNDAIVEINKQQHDAYLLDYRLGREDGLSLLKEINALEKEEPFILITGQDNIELDKEAMEAGASDFLVKGDISPSLLERTIRYAIQKKKVEATLEKEKEIAQMYLDIAGSMILVIDKEEKIQLLNQRGEEILEVKEEEVVGQNWFDVFIPKPKREEVRLVFAKLLANKTDNVEYYENSIQTKDGQQKLIWWHNRVLFEEGIPIGTISSGVDITKQKEVEESLKLSQQQLQQYSDTLELKVQQRTKDLEQSQIKLLNAQEIAQLAYIEYNLLNNSYKGSKQLYKILDLGSEKPMTFEQYNSYIHPDDRDYMLFKKAEAKEKGTLLVTESRIISAKGHVKHILTKTSKIINDSEGNPIERWGIIQDITALKTMEITLRENQIKLEKALKKEQELGELKSRFVSMASHEFRTPLSSILSSAELLGMYIEKERYEKCEKNINRIKSSVRNLTGILKDFLSLEKLESGKVTVQTTSIDIKEYLAELQEEIAPILKEGQQLQTDYPEGIGLVSDPHLLTNILINLLSNASKYSPIDKPISLSFLKKADHWLIQVKDHGIGIPEEDKAHMFSRFFRASNVENIKGTGLGLTIVKRYLDLLGGTIGFDSEYGKGSTFYFTLPYNDSHPPS